jgi:hypothetical protein
MPEATQQDFRKKKLNYYIELMDIPTWRIYKPYHLFRLIDNQINNRLT